MCLRCSALRCKLLCITLQMPSLYIVLILQGAVQATLAAAPLQLVQLYHADSSHYIAAAETIAVTGVMYILLGSTVSWLAAALLAPAVLTKASTG